MPLQATSGAASYDAFGGGVPSEPNYIESVFQTWLYTGNGSTQTINNGIDLSTKGGLVWIKDRNSGAKGHALFDTARGVNKKLQSQSTGAEFSSPNQLTAFNATGFDLGSAGDPNGSGTAYVSWTFREAPKFFDVVTYTGNGNNAGQVINHNLGSTPGFIICKCISTTQDWAVCARTGGAASPESAITYATGLSLNTNAAAGYRGALGNFPTSTTFDTAGLFTSPGAYPNLSGNTYVAYLFAHNAGGFGLTGTDNVISCGSFTSNDSGLGTVNLGYEPQWVMVKYADREAPWLMSDTMRGLTVDGNQVLLANTSDAESSSTVVRINSTGFTVPWAANANAIYIAIRRGPMKVPTDGTKVFAPVFAGSVPDGAAPLYRSTFPVDAALLLYRLGASSYPAFASRLNAKELLTTSNTSAAIGPIASFAFDYQNGWNTGASTSTDTTFDSLNFRRAPGFFDVVCYTGTGSSQGVAHNLGVVPELLIIKRRNSTGNWEAAVPSTTAGSFLIGTSGAPISLNTTNGNGGQSSYAWASNTGTATYFNPEAIFWNGNTSGGTFVAYLFATCPGVQSIQSYVGDGTTGRTINCGFTGGARFVCIKATSTTGSWWTFDSARGIVTNNDPALQLNSPAAEVTSADAVDTAASGFIVNQEATCSLNASGVSYLVWAIA